MTFHVGQKVVCVKRGEWTDEGFPPEPTETFPTHGTVYTVRHVIRDPKSGDCFIRLIELVNPKYATVTGPFEPVYWDQCFRPVRTTDISIFKAMLVSPPKQRVTA